MYRCPGINRGPNGQTYDWTPAASEADVDLLLRNGWSTSLSEALAAQELKEVAGGGAPANPAAAPTTPEERAKAAEESLSAAAERSLAAKRDLAAAEDAAKAADKTLQEATDKAAEADEILQDATSKASAAGAAKASATTRALTAGKALAACKMRAAAAEKTLTDAASNQLASDNLVTEAKEKALKAAEAAEKALASAEKGKDSKKGKTEPRVKAADEHEATLEDVKAALSKLKNTATMKRLLKDFDVTSAPELREDQYADVIAAVDEALKGK